MLRFISSVTVAGFVGVFSIACGNSPAAPTPVAAAPVQPGPTVTRSVTIEGPIDSIAPPSQIVVRGQVIIMRDDVSIMSDVVKVPFTKLRVGARVNVTGDQDGNGPIMASIVRVLDPIGEGVFYR